jgi:hypothetical protein
MRCQWTCMKLAVMKWSPITSHFLSPGLKYFTQLPLCITLGAQFFPSYCGCKTKQELHSLRSVYFDTSQSDKKGLSLLIVNALLDMKCLDYHTRSIRTSTVTVYLQLSLKRGAHFIISSADDSLFLTSPRFMFKYVKWMVEFALRQEQRAPSN